jgi:hypothetical protein
LNILRRNAVDEADVREPLESPPFYFYIGEFHKPENREDAILVEISHEDGHYWFDLPQFGVDVCSKRLRMNRLFIQMVERLASFHVAIKSMPPDHVTEIETEQLRLLEELFTPWLVSEMMRLRDLDRFTESAPAKVANGKLSLLPA